MFTIDPVTHTTPSYLPVPQLAHFIKNGLGVKGLDVTIFPVGTKGLDTTSKLGTKGLDTTTKSIWRLAQRA